MNALATIGQFGGFVYAFALSTWRRPPSYEQGMREGFNIGVRSLPILLIISFFVGTNLSLQGYNAFLPMGGERLVGMFVALAGVRELAPIMVASLVAAKAGTEMASQIAVMRIREQIDALEVMAINPYWYLVSPRFFSIMLILPALTMISIFTLVGSAWLVAVVQLGLNSNDFITLATATTRPSDLLFCAIKAEVFGCIICLASCFFGFHSAPGPTGVGRATNLAVVVSAVLCVILNYCVSELLYG